MSNTRMPNAGNIISETRGRTACWVLLASVASFGFTGCSPDEGEGAGRGELGQDGIIDDDPASGPGVVGSGGAGTNPGGSLVGDDGPATGGAKPGGDLVDGEVCNSKEVAFEKVIPTVMILVDRSSSMFDLAYGGSNDRWEPMRQAVSALEPFSPDVAFSLVTFTAVGGEPTCPSFENLMMAPATENFVDIQAALPESMTARPQGKGETPTGEAIAAATAQLKSVESDGPKYLLVITDGEPDTCAVRDPQCGQDWAIASTQQAFADGITTYVVGISDDVKDDFLNDLAHAGQGKIVPTPPFDTLVQCSGSLNEINMAAGNVGFDYERFSETAMGAYTDGAAHEGDLFFKPDNLETFQTQLGAIVAGVRTCAFEMDTNVNRAQASLGAVGLLLNDGSLEILEHENPNGWALHPTDDSIVELSGAACDKIQDRDADLVMNVKIEFPCDVQIPKQPK